LKEQQQWEHENRQLRTTLENRIKEIEEWKVRCSRLEQESNKAKEMSHYNDELTSKLQVSARELERLNLVLRNKLDEIEQWKKRVAEREGELGKLRNVENELANHNTRYSMLQAENDRINNIMKSKQGEIEEWKGKHGKLELAIRNFSFV
jgi:chromosome segregation ATPase